MRARDASATAQANLLALLAEGSTAPPLQLADWDAVLRVGRQARLLGVLHARLAAPAETGEGIPACVLGHLQAARNYAVYRRQNIIIELDALSRALPSDLPVVLLKGSSYVAQGLAMADGRMPGDVDIMVHREHLDVAEQALLRAGWQFQSVSDYDERYYRQWSHELPPLRLPGHPLELDLHHDITPVTGRVRPDQALLFDDVLPLASTRWRVLHPCDQIIHAALHLFQDSDFADRLRDLVDIAGLIHAHINGVTGWQVLVQRARLHGAEAPLWYAVEFCRRWLGLKPPEGVQFAAPGALNRAFTLWAFSNVAAPRIPDEAPRLARRLAQNAALARYHWLRMPPALLARHLVHKAWLTLAPRRAAARRSAAP